MCSPQQAAGPAPTDHVPRRPRPRRSPASPTATHVLQQRLLPHGFHQTFGVHLAKAQDVERATVCEGPAKRGTLFKGMPVTTPSQGYR